ncbi:hypothetical protein FRB99_004163 [Tulasnella sp. 403]|nr:hypothetical protein FRB99_004163 [Tulasnella sp. 403]
MLPPFNYEESFKYTQSPNPDFKPVSGLSGSGFAEAWRRKGEEVGYTVVDPENTPPRDLYRLLIGGVIPRPIAFVSSIAKDGTHNLAPFSYFNVVHSDPPIIVVSFSGSATKSKDTCYNILDNKTFTVNIISEPFVEAANWCSVDSPRDVDEWYGSGLTKEKSTLVAPPRVKESAFSMECELYQSIPLVHPNSDKPATGTLILGLIKLIHVRNDILVDPSTSSDTAGSAPRAFSVDPAKLRAVSRMGGITYGRIGEGFEIPRPVWEQVKDTYEGRPEDK